MQARRREGQVLPSREDGGVPCGALTVGLLALAKGVCGTSSLCNVSHGLGLGSRSEGVWVSVGE